MPVTVAAARRAVRYRQPLQAGPLVTYLKCFCSMLVNCIASTSRPITGPM